MERWDHFTTVEQMEEVSDKLKEMACASCADIWQDRVENQTPHCKFGDGGICCRICSMGPCRITPKSPRGICGADAAAMAGRNYLRTIAGGSATHSDHGRNMADVLYHSAPNTGYEIKDEKKLLDLAAEWGIETEGRSIYDIAHDCAYKGLEEYGKPFGNLLFVSRATPERQQTWEREGITPRAVDREVTTAMHMTHMGNTAMAEPLVRQGLRTGLADGWGGSMMGTEFSDILFGTPEARDTEAGLGCLEKDMVNIIVHGHDPAMSEMIVLAAEEKELIDYARSKGAKGINICGLCCTANEVAMRHGIKMAGNFLQQENALLTGVVELMAVDVQCIFPSLGPLSKCFHTKFITTSPIARIPDAIHMEFTPENALELARKMIRMAIDNFQNRDESKIFIPENMRQKSTVGYSCEQIIKSLDTVTNSHIDIMGTYKPLIECVISGVLRGAVAMVGCNNPKIRPDYAHIEIMKELLKNDIVIVATGCAAQAAAKAGLMSKEAKVLCGEGLKRVCTLADIPPVLHMGSCVDISRMMLLVTGIAKDWGIETTQLPVIGCAPEWMSEKAVSIANYVVSTGIDTYLGIQPQVYGSDEMVNLITEGTKKMVGAGFIINTDPHELVQAMINGIEAKRAAIGI